MAVFKEDDSQKSSQSSISSSNSSNSISLSDSTSNEEDTSPWDPQKDIQYLSFCDSIPDEALHGYLNAQVFRDTVDRSIKFPRRLLPPGCESDWCSWNDDQDLLDIANRSTTEIYLEGKFELVFRDVRLVMYDTDSPHEPIVFLHRGRFYKYLMGYKDLFVYPDRYETVQAFLQDWEAAERELEPVPEIRDDWYCLNIISDQSRLQGAYGRAISRRWGENLHGRPSTVREWYEPWTNSTISLLSSMFGYWFAI
ncbi:hypothetical protein C8J56DRAFT_952342 [Mycena floridula]|nr:hypothetical protein C8J56DRAFT_952342 [Mycena floridula]